MKNLTTKVMTILILFMANSCWLDWGNGNDPSSQKDAEDSIILAWVPCDNVSGIYTIDTAYITEDQLTAELTTLHCVGNRTSHFSRCGGYMESYPVQVDVFWKFVRYQCDDGAPFFSRPISAPWPMIIAKATRWKRILYGWIWLVTTNRCCIGFCCTHKSKARDSGAIKQKVWWYNGLRLQLTNY